MKKIAKKNKVVREHSSPKYPYTNAPGDLRRLLQMIPTKPRPQKLATSTANTWGIKSTAVGTSITVLKEIGLIDASNVPTSEYSAYMVSGTGGAVLGQKIRERYKELFEHNTNPQNASTDELKNFFNIHSGGAEKTIDYQIRTFKTLTEFAVFDSSYTPVPVNQGTANASAGRAAGLSQHTQIHFDLHVHLPEGKTASDYESIIRSISDHIVSKIRG